MSRCHGKSHLHNVNSHSDRFANKDASSLYLLLHFSALIRNLTFVKSRPRDSCHALSQEFELTLSWSDVSDFLSLGVAYVGIELLMINPPCLLNFSFETMLRLNSC